MGNKTKHLSPAIWFNIILVAAFAVGYLSWAQANSAWPFDNDIWPIYRHKVAPFKVSGELICLPYRNASLSTKECVVGLNAGQGNNYQLRDLNNFRTNIVIGQKYQISGILIQYTSRRYNSIGIINVQSVSLVR